MTTFPLSVNNSGRYLQTASGSPYRIKSDAGWITQCNFDTSTQNSYLDGIKALGFNATTLMGIVKNSTSWGDVNEPANFDGDQPFTGATFSTPNSAYFSKLSDYIDRANSRDLGVMFFHTYAGAGSDGWDADLIAASNSTCFNWGAYLASTFTQPNIIWMHMGDRTASGTSLTRWQNIIAGIQSVSRNRLAGCELDGPNSIITSQSGVTLGVNPSTSDMQISSFYGQGASQNGCTYVEAYSSYLLSVAGTCGPSYQTEPNYTNAFYDPKNSRSDIRSMIHWALSSGALGGTNFGEDLRWDGRPGILTSLTASATIDQSYCNAFYDSIKWWLLRPSGTSSSSPISGAGSYGTANCGRTLIVSGQGSGTSFISACMTSDGSQLFSYIPPTGTGTTTFSVDLQSMAGSTVFRWWNPTTGIMGSVIGTYPKTASSQSFTTPGDNGTGTNDWYLVGTLVADTFPASTGLVTAPFLCANF